MCKFMTVSHPHGQTFTGSDELTCTKDVLHWVQTNFIAHVAKDVLHLVQK